MTPSSRAPSKPHRKPEAAQNECKSCALAKRLSRDAICDAEYGKILSLREILMPFLRNKFSKIYDDVIKIPALKKILDFREKNTSISKFRIFGLKIFRLEKITGQNKFIFHI